MTRAGRDQAQARQWYLHFSKAELVDQLLAAESAYAEQEQRWLLCQDDLLTWRKRAETAEARLPHLTQRVQMNENNILPEDSSCQKAQKSVR